jgi:asparagine synthase (glutamine-hydrolysing)
MCGIASVLDLAGLRMVPDDVIQRMAQAIVHRGPDEDGFLQRPGVALSSRRLSIVGLADGQQPVANEDRSVFVVFNGESFFVRHAYFLGANDPYNALKTTLKA